MSNSTLLNQIVNQILNRREIHVIYERVGKNGSIEEYADSYFYLVECDDVNYIQTSVEKVLISQEKCNSLVELFTDEQLFCTDPEVIRTNVSSWDEFLNSF